MRFALNGRAKQRVRRSLLGTLALAASLALPSVAMADGPDAGGEPYEWKYLFPLLGDKAAAKGIKIPLPFGIGVNYAFFHQDLTISGVQIAVNDGDFVDLSNIVKFDQAKSTVKGLNTRLDLWLIPGLNVYVMGNYSWESSTDIRLSDPFVLRSGVTQTALGSGFGATGAFGFWGFFGALDANVSWNNVEKLNKPVRAFILTPRVGKKLPLSDNVKLSLWVGAMRQALEADTNGSISLDEVLGEPSDEFEEKVRGWYNSLGPAQMGLVEDLVERLEGRGPTTIHYKLDKAVAHPWNMLLGMEADFSDRVQLRTEVGFFGRMQLVLGVCYRFGLIPK